MKCVRLLFFIAHFLLFLDKCTHFYLLYLYLSLFVFRFCWTQHPGSWRLTRKPTLQWRKSLDLMRRYFYLIWRECREEIINEIYCQRFLIPPWENLSYSLPLLSVQKSLFRGLILRLVCCCVVTVMGRCCYYSCGCVLLRVHRYVEDLTQKDVINTTGENGLTL